MSKCDGVGFYVCVGGGQLSRISRHSHGTVELQWFRPRSLPWVFQVFGYAVDFNNSSVIDLSSEYSYFRKMVAVIGGGVVGGLGAFPPAPQIQPPTPSKGLCLNRHRGQTSEHARRIAWKSLHSIWKSYRHVATSSCGQEQGNFLCISRKFIGDE